jgi:hypothetical protein
MGLLVEIAVGLAVVEVVLVINTILPLLEVKAVEE